ncbi:hypothetical protein EVAR_29180_1 [Eumeta japonica]|uniref:Uncharacterized protein n=1 Tax=Eumeta variegata TaxID=151549 RepID=A0A4C1VBZ7_EUMVA|nr:hypothetical protein EVAR_29180_1 [Eumeta japonica]
MGRAAKRAAHRSHPYCKPLRSSIDHHIRLRHLFNHNDVTVAYRNVYRSSASLTEVYTSSIFLLETVGLGRRDSRHADPHLVIRRMLKTAVTNLVMSSGADGLRYYPDRRATDSIRLDSSVRIEPSTFRLADDAPSRCAHTAVPVLILIVGQITRQTGGFPRYCSTPAAGSNLDSHLQSTVRSTDKLDRRKQASLVIKQCSEMIRTTLFLQEGWGRMKKPLGGYGSAAGPLEPDTTTHGRDRYGSTDHLVGRLH